MWVDKQEGGGIRTLLALCQPPVPHYSPGSHVSWHGTTPAAWPSLSPWPPHASGVGLGLWLPCSQVSDPIGAYSPGAHHWAALSSVSHLPLNVPPLPHAPAVHCPISLIVPWLSHSPQRPMPSSHPTDHVPPLPPVVPWPPHCPHRTLTSPGPTHPPNFSRMALRPYARLLTRGRPTDATRGGTRPRGPTADTPLGTQGWWL